jgi:predicted transcriptional regulator
MLRQNDPVCYRRTERDAIERVRRAVTQNWGVSSGFFVLREPDDRALIEMATGRRKRQKPADISEMLGPLEAEVMQIIWMRGPSLVSEVEEILNSRRPEPLAYKTVLTICTRLSDKGILTHEKEGRAFRYGPTMTEAEFVADQASKAADTMLNRFGDVALATFVNQVATDPEQLAALRSLLGNQRNR